MSIGIPDPLYTKIADALDGEVDPYVFEDAACALLKKEYPGIAPVRGGGDAGMDGAISDNEGEPYPLACTVGGDPFGNLRESISSYLKKGGQRRKIVSPHLDI